MNNANARLIFNNAVRAINKAYKDAGEQVDVRRFKLTQSYLQMEQIFVVGQTSFTFPVLINQPNSTGVIFNTEQRLNLQDSFVPAQIAVLVALPTSSTDATYKKLTYLNPAIFTNAAAMQTLYNGQLSITVNNNVLVPAWDVDRHEYRPETQQTAPAGVGSPLDQFNGSEDGYYPMEPNVVMIGSKNIQLKLQLPAGITAVDTFSRIIIKMRGILAQNSTVVS